MPKRVLSLFLPVLLVAGFPSAVQATISANLSWTASSDSRVTGYNIYFGCASHQYSNSISVGAVTNVTIPELRENKTYYFAAKAHDSNGVESTFSNEAAFAGVTTTPNGNLNLKTVPKILTGNPLVYSLGAGAPAGATINPTNGVIYWTPGRDYASTTNYINVIVTDTVNPALSITETLIVIISDYLEFQPGCSAVYAGQPGSLPLTVASSGNLTNLQFTLNWPDGALLNPTLTFFAPITSGTLQIQGNQLIVQLQASGEQPLSGTNQVGQINFQTAAALNTAILPITASAGSGYTANGSAYVNSLAQSGEVVVVSGEAMLRPQTSGSTGRSMSLFAPPGTYMLQSATSLAAPVDWQPVMMYQQTNAAQTISLACTNPCIYYRLEQL